jgi:DUF4097 and DUF4098 domain-containing protein YvlB
MKKLWVFAMAALLLPIVFAFSGCGGVDLYMYLYAGQYTQIVSGGSYENVKDLDIDWVAGNITIKSGNVDNVTITERGDNAAVRPAYFRHLENGFMDIRYYRSGETRDTSIMKDLEIVIPNNTTLKGILINAPLVSNINIIGVNCDDVKITTNSSNVVVTSSNFSTAKVVSTTGDITFTSCIVDYTLTLNPNTGNVLVENCEVLDYSIYTFQGTITLKLDDESFLLDWTEGFGTCNYEDFGELTADGKGGKIYGDIEEDILHKISFEATHTTGTLILLKNGGQA